MKPLGLDSNQAVTIFASVIIPRSNPREILTETDLENYVSQAIWKFFDRYRKEAAGRLNANEIDLVLNEARVVGVKVDGHRVLNPQGFTGHEIEITLAGTIMRREDIKESLPAFELGTLRAYLLGRDKDFKNALYIEVFDELSKVFLHSPRYISYLSEFAWGKREIIDSLASAFFVPAEVAEGIYSKYVSRDISPRISRIIDSLFKKSFEKFLSETAACFSDFKNLGLDENPTVYVKSFPLPEEIYRKRFAVGRNTVKLSLAYDAATDESVNNHIYNAYSDLNELAKRRLKWLISSSV